MSFAKMLKEKTFKLYGDKPNWEGTKHLTHEDLGVWFWEHGGQRYANRRIKAKYWDILNKAEHVLNDANWDLEHAKHINGLEFEEAYCYKRTWEFMGHKWIESKIKEMIK